MSRSSLFKILLKFLATIRTKITGADNFHVEGVDAFQVNIANYNNIQTHALDKTNNGLFEEWPNHMISLFVNALELVDHFQNRNKYVEVRTPNKNF